MTSYVGAKGGETLSYEVESALGTNTNTWKDVRYEQDTLTTPANTRIGLKNANAGHLNAFDKSDKPIFIEAHRPNAISFTTPIRANLSGQTVNPIAEYFQSAGWQATYTSSDSVSGYSSTTAWDLDEATIVPGTAVGVTLADDSGTGLDNFIYPTLIAAKATNTVTPGMALPIATKDSEDVIEMVTLTPSCRVVPAAKTLSFLRCLRASIDGTDEDLSYELTGCALSSVGEMVIQPNMMPILPLTFHNSIVDQDESQGIANESFVDSEKFGHVTHNIRVELADSANAGGITRTDVTLIEASVDFGFSCVPIPGFGSGSLAGITGYVLVPGQPRITLIADFSPDYFEALEAAPSFNNPSQYLGIVQPVSSPFTPCWGVWMPKCHIDYENILEIDSSGDYITAKVPYIGSVSDYNSEVDNNEEGASPIFFAISDYTQPA